MDVSLLLPVAHKYVHELQQVTENIKKKQNGWIYQAIQKCEFVFFGIFSLRFFEKLPRNKPYD